MTTPTLPDRFMHASPIGEGGFATVYCATRDEDGETAAVKVLKPEYEDHPDVVASFFRDPHIVRSLDHPNIVRILDVGTPDEKPYYFTMEYCNGSDLKRKIQSTTRIPIGEVLQDALAICSALEHCHEVDLYHGDIKASNILYRESRVPVLSDFGNAIRDLGNSGKEPVDFHIGSPPYLSPEVWKHDGYSAESDLYSFGVLLYYALTGVFPHTARTTEEYCKLHLHAAPTPPSAWRPSISRGLDEIILALLEKDKNNRIPSARSLRDRLQDEYDQVYSSSVGFPRLRAVLYPGSNPAGCITLDHFPFRIGSFSGVEGDQRNQLVVCDGDPYVSRFHAVIDRLNEGFVFTDVSTNGSQVNGSRIHKQSIELLKENAIVIGRSSELAVHIERQDMQEPDDGKTSILTEQIETPIPKSHAWLAPWKVTVTMFLFGLIALRLACAITP